MKKMILSLGFFLVVSPSFGAIFLVEPMTCKAKQTSDNGYGDFTMTFTSFKSTRKDGTLANSLEVQRPSHSDGYMSPLYINSKGVINKELGAYNEKMKLTAKNYDPANQEFPYKLKLKGKMSAEGTVVGDTSYSLDCTATVVDTVTRIDDYTADK